MEPRKNAITLTLLAILIASDFLETFTQFCFKKAALTGPGLDVKGLADAGVFVHAMISSPFLWVGLVSVAATFVVWSTILSKVDLSVAVPICSFSYILIPLVSMALFHEAIPFLRWAGIALILAGVIMISLSSERTARQA